MRAIQKLGFTVVLGLAATAVAGSPDKALCDAADRVKLGKVQQLLAKGANVEAVCKESATPLILAAGNWNGASVIEALIQAGSDVHARNEEGHTPLHEAASYADLISILLDAGADIDARNNDGDTALKLAALFEDVEAIRLLLRRGADPSLRSKSGETARTINQEWTRDADSKTQIEALLVESLEEAESRKAEAAALLASQELQAKRERAWEQDKALPVMVRKDKYMVALTEHLRKESYEDALAYFGLLDRMEIELPPTFIFYYGEAYLRTGQNGKATEKLYEYIARDGNEGKHYSRALELVNEAEDR